MTEIYKLAIQYPSLRTPHSFPWFLMVLPNIFFYLPLLESHWMLFCSNVVMPLCVSFCLFVEAYGVSLPLFTDKNTDAGCLVLFF